MRERMNRNLRHRTAHPEENKDNQDRSLESANNQSLSHCRLDLLSSTGAPSHHTGLALAASLQNRNMLTASHMRRTGRPRLVPFTRYLQRSRSQEFTEDPTIHYRRTNENVGAGRVFSQYNEIDTHLQVRQAHRNSLLGEGSASRRVERSAFRL